MIILKTVEWGNTFSYASGNKIDFTANRLTQILGTNGVGKSSIPITLEEGLYNKNSKGFKKGDIPNRYIDEPYYIKTTFDSGGVEYVADIKKSSTLKISLTADGEDISSHTATATFKTLEEKLGMSFKTFSQLIYQNNQASLQFLTATDSKRKEFLIELFDMAEYIEKQAKFSDELKKVVTECSKLEGRIEAISTQMERASKNLVQEAPVPQDVPEFPESLLAEKAELELKRSNIQKANSEITQQNRLLKQLQEMRPLSDIEADIAEYVIPDGTIHTEMLGRLNSEISQAKAVVKKIKDLNGDTCPTCLQYVDPVFIKDLMDENTKDIEYNEGQIKEINKDLQYINSAKANVMQLKKERQDLQNLLAKNPPDSLSELLSDEGIGDSISSIQSEITQIKASIDAARAINSKRDIVLASVKAAEKELAAIGDELDEAELELLRINKMRGPLETLKKAFGPSGLIAYKLENKVQDLETETNKYLGRLSDGRFNISFELNKDKLNLVIFDNGYDVTVTSLSSGELARVVIATLLGIRKIMQSISKQSMNILFLDEVTSVMDEEGKELLVEVLLQEPGLNTFLVSHGWRHPLVPALEVVKEDEISRIL